MAVVHLNTEQRRFTGGVEAVEVEGADVGELIAALEARYPGLGALLEGCAVAIDGEFVNDPAYEPVPPGAELYFVAKAAGG